jgi:hypothetical protein
MSLNQIANISNAVPILKQERSQITTNPFIPNSQKIKELEELDKDAAEIIETEYNKNKTTSIYNLSIKEINKNVSSSVIGLLDDLFKKPKDIPWRLYIQMIIQKDQRYTYIGVLFIIVAIYMLLVK